MGEEEKREGSLCVCSCSYDEALRDFTAVVDLKPSITSGHINCGLVFLYHLDNPMSVTSLDYGKKKSLLLSLFLPHPTPPPLPLRPVTHPIPPPPLIPSSSPPPPPFLLLPLSLPHSSSPHSKAIKCLTTALSVDPTNLRALMCRAEAFTHTTPPQYHQSLLDWNRAVHMSPSEPSLYLHQVGVANHTHILLTRVLY